MPDERILRRRSIAETSLDDYVPRRNRTHKKLEGPVTKKQQRNRKNHQTAAYKASMKRYEKTPRARGSHNRRSKESYRRVTAALSEGIEKLDHSDRWLNNCLNGTQEERGPTRLQRLAPKDSKSKHPQ